MRVEPENDDFAPDVRYSRNLKAWTERCACCEERSPCETFVEVSEMLGDREDHVGRICADCDSMGCKPYKGICEVKK